MNVKQRRATAVGALLVVVLVGIGLWPMAVSRSFTADSSSFSAGADGRPAKDPPLGWSASASCSILLGRTSSSTEHMPMGTFVGEDLCGDRSGARLTLIVAIVFTVVGTIMAVLWFADVDPERRPAAARP